MSSSMNRHLLVCKFCFQAQASLSVHLRRKCMKDSTPEEIGAVVDEAKMTLSTLVSKASVWDYKTLKAIVGEDSRVSNLVDEMRNRGIFVTNVPLSTRDAPSSTPTPTSQMSKQSVQQPHECLLVLDAAKMDFLAVVSKIMEKKTITKLDRIVFLNYLVALLLLKHLLRPSILEKLTVKEWLERKPVSFDDSQVSLIGIREHETTATPDVFFCLDEEEASWFSMYFEEVRPDCLRPPQAGVEDIPQFFISPSGKPLVNHPMYLERFHRRYDCAKVTSQMARRAFETATAQNMSAQQRSHIASFLAHSDPVANQSYRMAKFDFFAEGAKLLNQLTSDPNSDSLEMPAKRLRLASTCSSQTAEQAIYSRLTKSFPVTLHGSVPSKEQRAQFTGEHDRICYDKWREDQLKMRTQHVLSTFSRRQPTESRLKTWMSALDWNTNCPDAAEILAQWKPLDSVSDAANNDAIQTLASSQKWTGLVPVAVPGKGLGVFTTRRFCQNEIVCDYHGTVISKDEGESIQRNTDPGEMGYLFFFKDGNVSKCIDAHASNCQCHPGMTLFGRLINHSGKQANLKPRHFKVVSGGTSTNTILFFAARDIKVNEELLYDYGINKRSFAGEGLDLDWL